MKNKRENLLISACLLGYRCRYDGASKPIYEAQMLADKYKLIPVCPELSGGLKTPREPCEIRNRRVVTESGINRTAAYACGAQAVLREAILNNCGKALLKEKSPSCGKGKIYDGTFSKTLTDGDGVAAALLKKYGIKVYGESEIDELIKND